MSFLLPKRDATRLPEVSKQGINVPDPGYPDPYLALPPTDPNALNSSSADKWMSRFERDCQYVLRPLRREPPRRKIKIAVLDTGIDVRNAAFAVALSKGLIKREDFVDPLGDALDLQGHGTHVAGILHKIAPWAEIYMARVIKDNVKAPDPELVTKALYRAASSGNDEYGKPNWDVDIITCSFGYYGWHKNIDDALRFAYARNKIVFAASSNNGTSDGILFPANLPTVICIHAADGYGTPSSHNPPPQPGKDLSILGEFVESAWTCGARRTLTQDQVACKRRTFGTSAAAPIAAGFMALVLELTYQGPSEWRQSGGIFDPELMYRLRTYNGVYSLLKAISEPKGGYQNIVPWLLLKRGYQEKEIAYAIKFVIERGERL